MRGGRQRSLGPVPIVEPDGCLEFGWLVYGVGYWCSTFGRYWRLRFNSPDEILSCLRRDARYAVDRPIGSEAMLITRGPRSPTQ